VDTFQGIARRGGAPSGAAAGIVIAAKGVNRKIGKIIFFWIVYQK